MAQTKYKRILLKLTGELFGPENGLGIDFSRVQRVANHLKHLKKNFEVEIAIVLGGGNLFRGRNVSDSKVDRAQADYAGMLGTIMNALILQGELEVLGVETRVMSSLEVKQACEPYFRRKALAHLDRGIIIILAGGSGAPFFTTDTTAALKAAELNCDILLKGSNVDGVYDKDPKKDPQAVKFLELSYQEALEKGLIVMDNTAFAICQSQKIPTIVFNIGDLENIDRLLKGERIGTLIQ
jgi:uridylate kinase